MKNKYRLLGIYLPIYALILLSTVTLRTVASLVHFDFRTHYFNEGALISVSNAILVVGIILMLTYTVTARKDIKLIPNFTSALTYVPTGIVGVALIFVAVLMLIFAIDGFEYAKMTGSYASFGFTGLLYVACAIFAICSAIHFALTATVETRTNAKRASFGLCTVIFLALYTAYIYFDTNLPINAPSKLIDEMAYLFSAVFFLYETRLSLGREKWRGYIAFGFIASLLTAYSSIPSLIVYFAKKELLSLSIYETLLTFALFLFITARIMITGELVKDKQSETVTMIINAANERLKSITHQEEVRESENEDNNENQITIADLEAEDESEADATSPTEQDSTDEQISINTPVETDDVTSIPSYVPNTSDGETDAEQLSISDNENNVPENQEENYPDQENNEV